MPGPSSAPHASTTRREDRAASQHRLEQEDP